MKNSEFERIVESYKDNVYAIAFHFFKNQADADDIVQEVFLRLYKAEKEFQGEEHIRNWLIRVAVNQCRKVSVSAWFTRRMPLEDYAEGLRYEDPEESDLFLAVMGLPTRYRVPVHLYYYEDYSVREIAQILGIRETTVTTRLMRARKMLKEKLLEVWKDD